MNRFADNVEPSKEYVSTIGVDFRVRTIVIDNTRVKLQIWDTAGQERYKSITTAYYRNAQGIILTYDTTCFDSFRQLNSWKLLIDKNAESTTPVLLIGNKSDSKLREVTKEAGALFAERNNMLFFETSAQENINIAEAFDAITTRILRTSPPQPLVPNYTKGPATMREVKKKSKRCTIL
jgi:small GTP-binding protein